jgi:hypothetical protein
MQRLVNAHLVEVLLIVHGSGHDLPGTCNRAEQYDVRQRHRRCPVDESTGSIEDARQMRNERIERRQRISMRRERVERRRDIPDRGTVDYSEAAFSKSAHSHAAARLYSASPSLLNTEET